MSGFKRTTINLSQEEYNRLRDAEERLRTLEKETPEERLQCNQQILSARLEEERREREQWNDDFHNSLSDVGEGIRELELRTEDSMVESELRIMENVTRQNEYTLDSINHLVSSWDDFIHTEQIHRQNRFLVLKHEVEKLRDHQESLQAEAANWIKSCRILLQHFIHRYSFAMDERTLRDIQSGLQDADQNFNEGYLEASLSAAQLVYRQLSSWRIEMECQSVEWKITHNTALLKARRVLDKIDHNRTCTAMDMKGNELPDVLEVDYWTQGKWNQVRKYTQNLVDQLEGGWHCLEIAILRSLIEETLPGLEEDLTNLIMETRIETLKSQTRIDIAEDVVRALLSQGFSLEEAGYEGGHDLRKSYRVDVRNLEGSEVIVRVNEGPGISYDLEIGSLDFQRLTLYEMRERARCITRSLQKHGLQVGALKTVGMSPDSILVEKLEQKTRLAAA